MYAVEFQTKIKNGIIKIPEKFRVKLKDNVKVILLADYSEYTTDIFSDTIEELLESPLKIADFRPYKREEIYDRG
ncbi:MAG: hypothetical protein HQK67_03440 [Desulfamplus sp.]|nr:hypothetical protein [Desulfamplus sp.]